jgi:ABC-2 type transport system ATP-binding protein
MEKALDVKNLTKRYGDVVAVNGINFTITSGEILALIGRDGAGKSTTLKMVSTILKPTEGTASIYGLDLLKETAKIRPLISYLPEEAGAYKNLTGREYLKFMASLYAPNRREQDRFVEFAEEITGLKDRLKDKVKTYSKGMTRKLLLARTIMSKPRLAILDEPTSGLDILNALDIRRTVRNLAKEGMAVLLSSHNMLEIEFLSDRVGMIYGGNLLETGTPEELKEKHKAGNLEEVFVDIVRK